MLRWLMNRVNIWVILGSTLVAGGLIILFGVLVLLLPLPASQANSQAALTVIVAPTPTPVPTRPEATLTPTKPPSVGGIAVGDYVQITGTDGAGLRLRSGPGTSSPSRLLGMDAEVFQVKEGPKMADDFTWWYLEAPYDANRSGWAVSKYLRVVNSPDVPTPTP